MKQWNKWLLVSVSLLFLSTDVLAHPGHDHDLWSAPMLHASQVLGLVFALYVGLKAYRIYRRR